MYQSHDSLLFSIILRRLVFMFHFIFQYFQIFVDKMRQKFEVSKGQHLFYMHGVPAYVLHRSNKNDLNKVYELCSPCIDPSVYIGITHTINMI